LLLAAAAAAAAETCVFMLNGSCTNRFA
jgi:hypothetical protein